MTQVLGREGDDTIVGANFVLAESRERGVQTWAGRITYRLRPVEGELRLAGKQVLLVNRDQPLPTLAFLI
jgi:benzoate/toluate 1,2-dioxygenase beta subunit